VALFRLLVMVMVVIVVVVMTVFIVTSMSDNALKSEEAADDGQEAQLHDWS